MNSPEEQLVALIPRNFMERGTFMGGMFKIRNAIEGAVLAAGIGIPVAHLPLSLTTRIVILCMTSLPAATSRIQGPFQRAAGPDDTGGQPGSFGTRGLSFRPCLLLQQIRTGFRRL